MRVITIILDEEGEAMPPVVHRQGVGIREAITACYEAHEALYAELPPMVIEVSPDLG